MQVTLSENTPETDPISPIIVDQNGHGTYTNIKEALAYAPEESTIYINNGIYREILIIRKNVYLKGEDKEKKVPEHLIV